MATHPGNGSAEIPLTPPKRDPRVPLDEVIFRSPVKVEGVSMYMTQLAFDQYRLVDGKNWLPPDMWFDRDLRVIKIGDYSYPMEMVLCFRQSKMKRKAGPAPSLEKFTLKSAR